MMQPGYSLLQKHCLVQLKEEVMLLFGSTLYSTYRNDIKTSMLDNTWNLCFISVPSPSTPPPLPLYPSLFLAPVTIQSPFFIYLRKT